MERFGRAHVGGRNMGFAFSGVKTSALVLVIVSVCTFCVWVIHTKSRTLREERQVQEFLTASAERLQRGVLQGTTATAEGAKRRKEAIALLSNGVFDKKVLLVGAQVLPPTGHKYGHPLFEDSPSLCWLVVDELEQVAWVGYADATEPNSFGVALFTVGQYRRLLPFEGPRLVWVLPLKCFGRTDTHLYPRLMKHDDGVSQAGITLELSVAEWNGMLLNRGQLILRDKKNHELDRVQLVPPAEHERCESLRNLILPKSDADGDLDAAANRAML